MNRIILYVFLICLLASCDWRSEIEVPYEPKIAVEGRIENGGYASVFLMISASAAAKQDTLSLLQHIVRSALVTVSDGEKTDTLSLRINRDRLPPYEYRGRKLEGEAGKSYLLTIKYKDQTLSSRTYIPKPVSLDSIWFKPNLGNDSIGHLGVKFKNSGNDFYQVSTTYYKSTIYTPCLYGNIDYRKYPVSEPITFQLSKGPTLYPKQSISTYYTRGDTVKIKFSVMPEDAYDFWCGFQNEIINATNPIFPAFSSLKSNIDGGVGLWSGYGVVSYIFILPKTKK